MAILIKQQKPGKNRAKIIKAEFLIKATGVSLVKNKIILEDINDIIQKKKCTTKRRGEENTRNR
jgi:hypothetical protein